MSLMAFFDMGKYAAFIWPAYGLTAIGFGWMIIDSLARSRRWRRESERLEALRQKDKRPGANDTQGGSPGCR